MMYIEYCAYNSYRVNYQALIDVILYFEFQAINIPVYMVPDISKRLPSSVFISVPIDYPLGLSSVSGKSQDIGLASTYNVDAIDYVPNHYHAEKNIRHFKDEIRYIKDLCDKYRMDLRVFIDVDRYHRALQLAKMVEKVGANAIFPVIGYHNTDFYDTMISAEMIATQISLPMIFNGYIWRADQLKIVRDSNLFGVRLYDTRCFQGIGQTD